MDEHFDQFKNGAKFTSIFPPRRLQVIKWYNDEDTAKKAEKSTAKDIRRKAGGFLNPSVLDFPDQD